MKNLNCFVWFYILFRFYHKRLDFTRKDIYGLLVTAVPDCTPVWWTLIDESSIFVISKMAEVNLW